MKMSEVSKYLSASNVAHVEVSGSVNPGVIDGATAEEIMMLMHGIKSHMGPVLTSQRLNDSERSAVFHITDSALALATIMKRYRYKANLTEDEIQVIMEGLTNVMRSINASRKFVDKNALDKCVALIHRGRDLLMNYGIRSRQPAYQR